MSAHNHYSVKSTHRDQRVQDWNDERKWEKEDTNDTIVDKMITRLQAQAPNLAIPTMISKVMARHNAANLSQIHEIVNSVKDSAGSVTANINKFSPEQMKQLTDLNAINKVTNQVQMEMSPFAKHLGEIAGALGVVQQITSSKAKSKEQDQHQDNITKAIYHMQNGGKFGHVAPALGVGTLRAGMNSAAMVSAGSWLYDMMNTGQLSGMTTGSLALSNPGMMASSMFGGMAGLGKAAGAVGAKGLGAASWLAGNGTSGLSGSLAKGASALSALDPTTAAILGTLTVVGTSIGAKKLMDNIMKNSPLSAGQRQKRWNLSHTVIRASDNPINMANYVQANSILKNLQNQQVISPAEGQIISKLNEIAFYTSSIQELYEYTANVGHHRSNSSTNAANKVDEDPHRDMAGFDTRNLFANGRMSKSMEFFLRHNEGLSSIFRVLNPGTYIDSLKGKDTMPGQFKLREALNHGDPEAAKKNFAIKHGITLSDVDLIHGDIKAKIANADDSYEGRMLAANMYQAMYLQSILTNNLKSFGGGKGSIIGELARLEREQEQKYLARQSILIDETIKPVLQTLAKVPVLSAAVPFLHAAGYIGKTGFNAISGIGGFARNMATSKGRASIKNGVSGFFGDMKSRMVDSLRSDSNKSEASVREKLGANALSLQDQANMYIARQLPQDMQKIQWLLGSTEKAKVQDRYTGEFVEKDELKKRYDEKLKKLKALRGEEDPEETLYGEAKRWMTKKLFGITDRDMAKHPSKTFKHFRSLKGEFRTPGDELQQDQNTQFRMGQGGFNQQTANLNSSLHLLVNTMIAKNKNGNPRDAYYQMMHQYIPMLEEIRDCVCKDSPCKDSPCKDSPENNLSGSKALSKKFKDLLKGNAGNAGNTDQPANSGNSTNNSSSKKNAKNNFNSISGNPINPINPINPLGPLGFVMGSLANQNGQSNQSNQSNSKNKQVKNKYNTDPKFEEKYFDLYFKSMAQLEYLEKIYEVLKDKDMSGDTDIIAAGGGKWAKKAWSGTKNAAKSVGKFAMGAGRYAWAGLGLATEGVTALATGVASIMVGGGMAAAIAAAAVVGSAAFAIDYMFNDGKVSKSIRSSLTNMLTSNDNKKEINLRKDPLVFKTMLNGKGDTSSKLSFINEEVKNGGISEEDAQKHRIALVQKEDEVNKNKYGYYLTPDEIKNHKADLDKMSSDERLKYFQAVNSTTKYHIDGKINPDQDAQYKEVSKMIGDIFAERLKQDAQQRNTPEVNKDLNDSLKGITESNLQQQKQLETLVQNHQEVSKVVISSLNETINSVSNQAKQISDNLAMTAKVNAKPNVYTLDPTVLSLIPSLQ